ncbi:MAG: hypothetical protein IKE01_03250 [Clostridia bacterium]|nr:hypothetical protein [Clostridia bacterium]
MKKNYTLKLVLAMLVVVLVSLVSFVGVYKGKNLLKEYALGKDFSQKKVATFVVVKDEESEEKSETSNENESSEEKSEENAENNEENKAEENEEKASEDEKNAENTENSENNENKKEEISEEQRKKNYVVAKNNIAKRFAAMKSEDFDIRLDEETGTIAIEVPANIDSAYISQIFTKGKVEIKNTSSNDVIVDSNVFKDASARLDTSLSSYSKPIVILDLKFTNDAKKKICEANTKYTNSEGNEESANFAVVIDHETLYSDAADTFIESAKKGELSLVMGQNDEKDELEEDYQKALAITSIMKCGEIPVEYEIESMDFMSANFDLNRIIVAAIIAVAVLIICATVRFKLKGTLCAISLIGLIASILLVLRYTNVKITMFSILGIAIITGLNYFIILKTLEAKKSFKENFLYALKIAVPCIIMAIVFCASPYLQLASFGMSMFWGLIVMCIYNVLITRVFIRK